MPNKNQVHYERVRLKQWWRGDAKEIHRKDTFMSDKKKDKIGTKKKDTPISEWKEMEKTGRVLSHYLQGR